MRHLYAIFARLYRAPSHVSDTEMDEIQRYVILLYHRTPSCKHVNVSRKQLFAFANRNIPPTSHALEHVKRSMYQAGYVWGLCLVIAVPEVPFPELWGGRWAGKSQIISLLGHHFGLFFPKRPINLLWAMSPKTLSFFKSLKIICGVKLFIFISCVFL